MHALRTIIALLCVLVAGAFAAPVEVNDDYIVNNSTTENFDNPAASETHQHGAREVGQATYYIAGLGSCGVTNNGQAQDIVALPHGLMGAQSNGNPFCGKTVSISYKGKTASGTVQDKCMGCGRNDIDLSEHLFKKLAPLSVGRLNGVEWHVQ